MTELADDLVAHRDWLVSFVPVRNGALVADLGCGAGHDLLALSRKNPAVSARFVGLDVSDDAVTTATIQCESEPRVSFTTHDLDRPLPFEASSLDCVFSNNLVECLADRAMFAREVARVLRIGGTLVVAHWDWDSQVFDGRDKARIRRLIHAFADWQQPWMKHSDGWMGRRLRGTFESVGHFEGTVQMRSLTNSVFSAPWYGHARAQDMRSLLKRALVSGDDVDGFLAEQAKLNAEGRYFYSITSMAYVGMRIT